MDASSDSAEPSSSSENGSDAIARSRRAREFFVLSISLIFILIFSYLNIYGLPLGTTSVSGVIQNADALCGFEVGVRGMIFKLTEREFFLANDTTSIQLEAIWLGGANLPPNGTSVVASGQIVKGPDGPVMMCDQLSPSGDSAATFDNPWVLPALRFLAPALIWFLLMVLATGILSLIHLGKPARLGRNRMVAVAEMSTVAGAAVMIPVTALFFLERALGGLVGGLTYCVSGAFVLLLLSAYLRRGGKREFRDIADAMPILAAIIALIGTSLALLQIQASSSDLLGIAVTQYSPESAPTLILGISGLFLLGIFISEHRFEALRIRDLLAQRRTGVK